ncbi:MAG TPA: MarR family transcriptional regulator [Macromonas sp.]|nr:MarR family transcriptional regulator [Macromonas sp.]
MPNSIGFLVTEVGRLYRLALDRKMARFGLARSEWWVLAFLVYLEGSTQQELADVADLGKSAIAKLLDKLEQRGLVRREADPNDGRSKRVFLTDKIRSVVGQISQDVNELEQRSLEPFSSKENAQLLALLTGLRAQLLSLPDA